MGRKNRRRGGRELGADMIRDILESVKGMKLEPVIIDDPAMPTKADIAYQRASNTCDRILRELEEELEDHHVRKSS